MTHTDAPDRPTPAQLEYESAQARSVSLTVVLGVVGLKLLGLYLVLGLFQALAIIILAFVPLGGISGSAGMDWTGVVAWSVPGLLTSAIGALLFVRARELSRWMFKDLPGPVNSAIAPASALSIAITAIGIFLIVHALPVLTGAIASWLSSRAGMTIYYSTSGWDSWDQSLFKTGIITGLVRLVLGILLICFSRRIAAHPLIRAG